MKKVTYLKKFDSTITYQMIENNLMKILSFSQYEEQFGRYELLGLALV